MAEQSDIPMELIDKLPTEAMMSEVARRLYDQSIDESKEGVVKENYGHMANLMETILKIHDQPHVKFEMETLTAKSKKGK